MSMSKDKKTEKTHDFETYFLVSQQDLYKIDGMIGALNLAITEIMESRPVKDRRWETTPAQWDYDERINAIIHWNDPIEF